MAVSLGAARRYGRYSRPEKRSSLSNAWVASIRRTVPERERITIESVTAPSRRVAHAAQQRARRDAGRRDEDVVPGDEVVGGQNAVGVEAGVDDLLPLAVVARPELP